MPMPSRVLPPAGFPLALSSVSRAILPPHDVLARFERSLARRFGVSGCVLASSGRAALSAAIEALAERSSRTVVVVPAYTCYTVPAAVVRAGLRVLPCDIDPFTLDFAPASLGRALRDDVLAVIAVGLYGLPADLPATRHAAVAHGSFVIDDAAQCFGGELDGVRCGAGGDLGLLSFGRGKGLTTLEGGALLSDDVDAIDAARGYLDGSAPRSSSLELAARAAAYAVLRRPALFALVHGIQALGLGLSVFDPAFERAPMGRAAAALGAAAIERVDDVIQAQRERAARYLDRLRPLRGLTVPTVRPGAEPVWLRFPILVEHPEMRRELLSRLTAQGLGATGSYPAALSCLDELRPHLAHGAAPCPGAEAVARSIVTLPTHPGVRPGDQDRIVDLVASTLSARD